MYRESMNRGFTVLIIHIFRYVTRYEIFSTKKIKFQLNIIYMHNQMHKLYVSYYLTNLSSGLLYKQNSNKMQMSTFPCCLTCIKGLMMD